MNGSTYTFLPLIVVVLTVACGSSRSYRAANSEAPSSGDREAVTDAALGGAAPAERKLLYSAWLTLEIAQPDSARQALLRIAERYAGYLSTSSSRQTVIRVRSHQLQAALRDIEELGKVVARELRGEDVTAVYRDERIRLDNAQRARQRYLDLLQRAQTVEEALGVERELERLTETIDLLQSRLNQLDHLEEYSTITVHLREKPKPGLLGYVGLGLYRAIKWLFIRN